MTTASIKLGKIWNIPIGLHWSWLIVFALVSVSLAFGVLPQKVELSTAGYLFLGVLTSILFFASVLLHELGHTYVALRYGVPVREINLFIFGGVAIMSKEPPSAKAEFWIAIAGPAVSLLLAAAFGLLWLAGGDFVYLAAPAYWLAWINLSLAVFNMIPGFPLDGGRVFRSIVWHVKGNLHRATQISSGVGQVVALGFIAWGVYMMLTGNFVGGLWIAFIGWFLQNAAAATLQQSNLEQSLKDVRVCDMMTFQYKRVPARLPLESLVDSYILRGEGRAFFVSDGGDYELPRGLVTLNEIVKIPRENWSQVTAGQVMIPAEKLVKVEWHDELLPALRKMDEANVAQVPVMEKGRLVGILAREQILHHIRLRSELGIDRATKAREKATGEESEFVPHRAETVAG